MKSLAFLDKLDVLLDVIIERRDVRFFGAQGEYLGSGCVVNGMAQVFGSKGQLLFSSSPVSEKQIHFTDLSTNSYAGTIHRLERGYQFFGVGGRPLGEVVVKSTGQRLYFDASHGPIGYAIPSKDNLQFYDVTRRYLGNAMDAVEEAKAS